MQPTIEAVALCIQAGIPCLLMSEPGNAKTAIVSSLFSELCNDSHTSIVGLHEPTEFAGFGVPQGDSVAMMPTQWVKRLAQVNGRTGVFLDELTNAPPATRSACLRGIHERVWGDTKIENLSTVAAANPPDIAESGYEFSAPLANRFLHIAWEMSVEYWVDQMLRGFPAPKFTKLTSDPKKHLPFFRGLVASFSRVKPTLMQALPEDVSQRSGAWPSFRTWTMGIDALCAARAAGFDFQDDVTVILLSGCVGGGAASEFLTYATEMDLPDPFEVLKNPSSLKLPERGDRAFAVLTSVVSAFLSDPSQERWEAAWKVMQLAVDSDRPDVAAVAVQTLAKETKWERSPAVNKSLAAFVPLLKNAGLLRGSS